MILCGFLVLLFGTATTQPDSEVVMVPGMEITVTMSAGRMTITADSRFDRSYTWAGATRSVRMSSRRVRENGSLGLYWAGPGDHWAPHDGITRAVTEEGQQHFKSADAAMQWLKGNDWVPKVWRNDGLVVGWRKYPPRQQLSVEVWQIYIDGKKPTTLPGSRDDDISVTHQRATTRPPE